MDIKLGRISMTPLHENIIPELSLSLINNFMFIYRLGDNNKYFNGINVMTKFVYDVAAV